MFRFSSKGTLPRHNNNDLTYLLYSRKSIYCVHREVHALQQGRQRRRGGRGGDNVHDVSDVSDELPTKSCILGFRFKQHAERMRRILTTYQHQGRVVDGTVRNGVMNIENISQGRPISNLDIRSYRLEEVEKQCLMDYFDLWLVADMAATDESSLQLDVYEYITTEPPHRSYINHQLERLLRN